MLVREILFFCLVRSFCLSHQPKKDGKKKKKVLLLKQEDIAAFGHPEGLSLSRESCENSISVPYII